jgi:hypothetical protein
VDAALLQGGVSFDKLNKSALQRFSVEVRKIDAFAGGVARARMPGERVDNDFAFLFARYNLVPLFRQAVDAFTERQTAQLHLPEGRAPRPPRGETLPGPSPDLPIPGEARRRLRRRLLAGSFTQSTMGGPTYRRPPQPRFARSSATSFHSWLEWPLTCLIHSLPGFALYASFHSACAAATSFLFFFALSRPEGSSARRGFSFGSFL